jgi:hypothetical protein
MIKNTSNLENSYLNMQPVQGDNQAIMFILNQIVDKQNRESRMHMKNY